MADRDVLATRAIHPECDPLISPWEGRVSKDGPVISRRQVHLYQANATFEDDHHCHHLPNIFPLDHIHRANHSVESSVVSSP